MEDHPSAVLAAYGHTVLVWQIVEQPSRPLWVMSLIGEYETATNRNFKKALRRSIHAATKATASETLNGLSDRLDAGLMQECDAANQ